MNNFDESINRFNTASVKWDFNKEIYGTDDLLPMWVADMDFRPPEAVITAIKDRAEHGVFGYTFVPPSVHSSIKSWLHSKHDWEIRRSWLLFCPGVVQAIATSIQAFTAPGDRILIQSPVYTPFFEMVEKNGRIAENAPLLLKEGRYEIDFNSFEDALIRGCKLFLLCSPHNPVGRVWSNEELMQMAELCVRYNCLILSDEIHSDLVLSGRHIPIASLNQEISMQTITCIAPSKTFNLAGLQSSAVIIENGMLREMFEETQKKHGFFTLNTFGITAMEAAYSHGGPWLEALKTYLRENVKLARTFIEDKLPMVKMIESEGTYLIWLDCRGLGLNDTDLNNKLVKKGKIGLEPGMKYGPGGEGFVRMNIACPRATLEDGLQRLQKALSK